LTRTQDIEALTDASLGYKALREHKYELAHDSLCQSNALLQKTVQRAPAGRPKTDATALSSFVVQSAGRAITQALAESHYSGTLRPVSAANPCPGGKAVQP